MKKFAQTFVARLAAFYHDEEGATAVEYGLLAALIALVVITAVSALGVTLSGKFNELNNGIH